MMGADFSAYTVLGVRVCAEDLIRKRNERSCEHPIPSLAKFCPDCGKPTWVEKTEWLIDLDALDHKGSSYSVVSDTNSENYYFGLRKHQPKWKDRPSSNGGPNAFGIPLTDSDIEEARIELHALLHPLGLWSDSKFRLWTILYCSC